ncbi:MAG: flavin reductase family protein [Desulfomonilaceae bacterium]
MSGTLSHEVFREISYGLYVVTSKDGEKGNGQIVNTVLQVTSDPPKFAVIVNRKNLTHDYILQSGVFGVSVLSQDAPMTFIGLFGFKSGRDVDKLAKTSFIKGITGCPLVTEHALGILECNVVNFLGVGTHTIFVGEVVQSQVLGSGRPLTYEYYHSHLKGKTAQNAPTYIADKKS